MVMSIDKAEGARGTRTRQVKNVNISVILSHRVLTVSGPLKPSALMVATVDGSPTLPPT